MNARTAKKMLGYPWTAAESARYKRNWELVYQRMSVRGRVRESRGDKRTMATLRRKALRLTFEGSAP
jgi:hypothetical protein